MDRAGVVLEYNHDESERSALPRSEVVGRNFFVVVGRCTNNLLVAGRFRRAASEQLDLDEEIDYVFTFRLRPVPVRLRMLAGREAEPAVPASSGPGEVSPVDPGPTPAQDLTDALQMLYQCPVGLLELDDAGLVRTINPAAVRMLLPGAPDRDLRSFFPLLRRLDPALVDLARKLARDHRPAADRATRHRARRHRRRSSSN